MTAGWFSLLTFGWMNGLMVLGYARPLEASDLWKLQDHRSAGVIAEDILTSFEVRRKKADEYNARLSNGEIKPPLSLRVMSRLRGDGEERTKRWREKDGKAKPSLTWAMNDAIKWWFWSGGILKVIGDTAQITSPLILKVRPFLWFMVCFFCNIYARLSVPHQIRDHFVYCSSRGYPGPRDRKRNWARSCPRDFANNCLALSASLFLSVHLDWRSSSRRSHHGDLFAFSSIDDPCSSNAAQWQISKSHLDRRLPNRLLLWFLSHVLGFANPNGDLSCLTDIHFGTECSRRIFCVLYSYPGAGQDHEEVIPDSPEDDGMDG